MKKAHLFKSQINWHYVNEYLLSTLAEWAIMIKDAMIKKVLILQVRSAKGLYR